MKALFKNILLFIFVFLACDGYAFSEVGSIVSEVIEPSSSSSYTRYILFEYNDSTRPDLVGLVRVEHLKEDSSEIENNSFYRFWVFNSTSPQLVLSGEFDHQEIRNVAELYGHSIIEPNDESLNCLFVAINNSCFIEQANALSLVRQIYETIPGVDSVDPYEVLWEGSAPSGTDLHLNILSRYPKYYCDWRYTNYGILWDKWFPWVYNVNFGRWQYWSSDSELTLNNEQQYYIYDTEKAWLYGSSVLDGVYWSYSDNTWIY